MSIYSPLLSPWSDWKFHKAAADDRFLFLKRNSNSFTSPARVGLLRVTGRTSSADVTLSRTSASPQSQ